MMSSVAWFKCIVWFLLCCSNFWSQNIVTTYAFGNETDQSALLKFKESIDLDPNEVFNSWNSTSHFCKWNGVTCSPRHQRVTELNLTGCHLHGFISPYIGNLSFLRKLFLEDNHFYGEIPQELGRLFRIRVLYFTNNILGGEFPISLANCSELRYLSLDSNLFTGEIPRKIESFGNLKQLRIRGNNLTGQIPPSIGNLSSLTRLSLSSNTLQGFIPEEIGLLRNLRILGLSNNKLSHSIPLSLYNLSSLYIFSLTNNQFNGSFPDNMFLTLPNLEEFTVSGNQFSGSIPASITNASGMQILDIGDNQLVGQVPSLGKWKDISTLQLSLNNLGNNSSNDLQFLKSLINCSQLDILDIGYNNFGGPFPRHVSNLTTKLTQLIAGGNNIFGEIPMELGNLVNLITLALEKNSLTGIIPTSFGKLQKMQLLSLGVNKLFGEIPPSIGNLSQLYYLELSSNMFVGNIPSTIGNCQHLQFLHLSNNSLTGAIPSQLFGIPSLSTALDLSYNSLSGSLSAEVGMLKNIDILDVSENYISGVIPETIGECITLEYLYLKGNSFHGSMPPSLASLKGLREVDLSRNNLSGSIPETLQNLSFLEYFNASFNMLEGKVPTNGVFQNASSILVAGNSKLCGGISELKLPPCPLEAKTRRIHHNLKLVVAISCVVFFLSTLSCILGMFLIRKRHKKSSTNSTIDQLPKVSYQNLLHATDGFSSWNLIGTGSHGSVYKGILDPMEGFVAIKVLNLQKKGAKKSFMAECKALRHVRHRNLVKVVTCCSSVDYNGNDFKALVFEYMPNGSLEEWLHPQNGREEQTRTLNLETRLEIVVGVASALHYLHHECEEPIIHCDLKPSNILLDDDMVAHVSDFGLARLLSTINNFDNLSTSGIKGTIGYCPPENGASFQVSTKGDMYSFGILILEMLTGRRPTEEMFKDGHNLHNYAKISFPNNLLEIVDATLVSVENVSPTITASEQHNISEIADNLHLNTKMCLLSLFKIGLACSVELPGERLDMMEVIRELNMIRNAFYA
ncbi:probable LRR receptor-like serine/threonine-protein kinase At3g47570 [Vigna radiata var. radiata]|uniref:non-specific serine/threonine protein kinase n=1 Tax=Vigna radiata var. radiata TaxID=3916 RepID=A0A1S3TSA1_VIGRR|nr:probable LRR receptor-like serine/threonine-protein kinase At3g47570 [Vigna radiata var. radiata]